MHESEPKLDTLIVRFGGEIGIKAPWTRKLYERRLLNNAKAALKHHGYSPDAFIRQFGRLYVKTAQAQKMAKVLSKVFGITSLSPAVVTGSRIEEITGTSARLAAARFHRSRSFAVRCRRIGKHSYSSQDVCRQVGDRILTSLPEMNLKVDLTRPHQTLNIEIRDDKAYIFTDTTYGAGGLPVGTQPKAVCLLDGSQSSAVAAWMMMKRGCPVVLLNFTTKTETDNKTDDIENAKLAAEALMEWAIGFPRKLYAVQSQDLAKLTQQYPSETSSLLYERLMLRVAQRVAGPKRAEGIATGDRLDKPSGLTVHRFRIQDEAVEDYPVFRPVLGLEPHEIKETGERIGLKNLPLLKERETGHDVKNRPRIGLQEIKRIESQIEISKIVEDAMKSLTTIQLEAR